MRKKGTSHSVQSAKHGLPSHCLKVNEFVCTWKNKAKTLCCAVLCCALLCYAVLCCAVLCCAMLCHKCMLAAMLPCWLVPPMCT